MGISSIFSSVIKGVTWAQVASVAMEYGPELYRKVLERFQPQGQAAAESAAHEMQDRLARLETLLLEQEEIMKGLVEKNRLLEAASLARESRITQLKVVVGLLACGCAALLVMLLK